MVPPNTTDKYSDIIEMWKNEIQNKTKWNKIEANDWSDYKTENNKHKGRIATSKFNGELKDIIKSALGENHFITSQYWNKNTLDEFSNKTISETQ